MDHLIRQKTIHEKLTELAGNLWWSWQPDVTDIFREINPVRWSELGHNPIPMLREYGPDKLEQRAREEVLHSRIHGAYRRWLEYMGADDTWGDTHAGVLGHRLSGLVPAARTSERTLQDRQAVSMRRGTSWCQREPALPYLSRPVPKTGSTNARRRDSGSAAGAF